jgi:hypothetical protein
MVYRAQRARDNEKLMSCFLTEAPEISERMIEYQEYVGLILGVLKSEQLIIL